jgi:hypothetical protein
MFTGLPSLEQNAYEMRNKTGDEWSKRLSCYTNLTTNKHRQCTHNVTLARSHNHCYCWKATMHLVFSPPPPLSQKTQFSIKMLLNIIFVFWFRLQLLSETFLILRRFQRATLNQSCGYSIQLCQHKNLLSIVHRTQQCGVKLIVA